jgi:hypothetical protein
MGSKMRYLKQTSSYPFLKSILVDVKEESSDVFLIVGGLFQHNDVSMLQ